MQIFFVIDSVKNLDDNIKMLSNVFDASFKFFVPTKLYTSINQNKFVLENLAGVFDGNAKVKIDEYIKSNKFELSDVLLYYSSVSMSAEKIYEVQNKIKYNYDSIYLENPKSKVKKFFEKVYNKLISWFFKAQDACASTKVQYMSRAFMSELISTKFNNHIFKATNSVAVQFEEENKTIGTKFSLQKTNLYNAIVFFMTIVLFVICIVFVKMMFWVYFLFIMLLLLEIALAIMFVANNIFYVRFNS